MTLPQCHQRCHLCAVLCRSAVALLHPHVASSVAHVRSLTRRGLFPTEGSLAPAFVSCCVPCFDVAAGPYCTSRAFKLLFGFGLIWKVHEENYCDLGVNSCNV